jgi:hypothetical protein
MLFVGRQENGKRSREGKARGYEVCYEQVSEGIFVERTRKNEMVSISYVLSTWTFWRGCKFQTEKVGRGVIVPNSKSCKDRVETSGVRLFEGRKPRHEIKGGVDRFESSHGRFALP